MVVVVMSAGVEAQPNHYRRVEQWAQLPEGFQWGALAGAAPDAQGNLWVLHRAEVPILQFDRSGRLIKSFGEGMFSTPHGMHVDTEGHLWVVDSGPFSERRRVPGKGYQVFKFSQDGEVLMTLGKPNVSRAGPDSFIAPTGVVVNAEGEIFVVDGHTPRGGQQDGDRIVKFSRDGRFIKAWGQQGSEPGELHGPHGVAMDSQGRLFVADRSNNRVQIFDQDGQYLGHWMHFGRPSGIWIDEQDVLYVADNGDFEGTHPGWAVGIRIGSAEDGSLTGFIPGTDPEVVVTDVYGNVYAGLVQERTLQKYAKR